MSALDVRHLTLNFGGLKALNDLSFSVDQGERLVIFGPNGAGKTTLFNVITGLFAPTRGSLQLFGTELGNLGVERRVAMGIGRTFQITTLFPRLSVLESAMLAIQAGEPTKFNMIRPLMSYQAIRRRALDLLEQWDVADKAAIETKSLSYGEQRQIELVLALARKPRLLLLDEPAAGLSVAETNRVEAMIELFPRDMTVMLIEHDVDMALRIADRVLVLQQGALATSGTPDEIRNDPMVAQIYFGAEHV